MLNIDPRHEMEFQAIALERRSFQARAGISNEFLSGMELSQQIEHHTQRMILGLRKDVMAHKQLTQDTQVPFEKDVTVDLPNPRWHPAPGAIAAVGLTFAAIAAGSLLLIFTAMLTALATVVLLSRQVPTIERTVPIRGEVTVRAEQFALFPESTMRYPDSLGSPVIQIAVQAT